VIIVFIYLLYIGIGFSGKQTKAQVGQRLSLPISSLSLLSAYISMPISSLSFFLSAYISMPDFLFLSFRLTFLRPVFSFLSLPISSLSFLSAYISMPNSSLSFLSTFISRLLLLESVVNSWPLFFFQHCVFLLSSISVQNYKTMLSPFLYPVCII
jgi:hypothetical protein